MQAIRPGGGFQRHRERRGRCGPVPRTAMIEAREQLRQAATRTGLLARPGVVGRLPAHTHSVRSEVSFDVLIEFYYEPPTFQRET
jgi:hypothetical protein